MTQLFPIVGIGASAGGLDALKAFLPAVPAPSGLAFIVVVHMPPDHRTLLAEVLASLTPMPVVTATEGLPIVPDHLYVAPSNAYVGVADGRFHLTDSDGESLRHPVDQLFESLALQAGAMAVGVVLSGAGNDGAAGARTIAMAGGHVFAQSPESAAHDNMPTETMAAVPDCDVAPPDRLPLEILRRSGTGGEPGGAALLEQILAFVRDKTGRDFQGYKPRTLLRRIARRMDVLGIGDAPTYLARLRQDAEEAPQLADFLILGVTEFFRDGEAFAFLAEHALTPLLRSSRFETRVRAWVAGCSTGEEAYSLAITLLELLESLGLSRDLKVFATDIDAEALDFARAGAYDERALRGVSADRLARFFEREPDGYRVAKRLRECVVFSIHDLLRDPPFSHLDLVSCRNVLIYLDAAHQASILPLFHYALNPDGILLLGPSETLGRFDLGFESLSKKWRVFRKLPVKLPVRLNLPSEHPLPLEPPLLSPRQTHLQGSIGQLIRDAVLTEFAPAVVMIDRSGRVLHYSGPTERVLALPKGPADYTLASMIRAGLRRTVRRLFEKVWNAADDRPIQARATLGGKRPEVIRISAKLARPSGQDGALAMLVFENCGPAVTTREEAGSQEDDESLIRELEIELEEVRNDLQSNIEALVTSNEELRTSNEEVMSTNEELQATNEELETSKEEMQSVNEELSSVNAQLGTKVEELAKSTDDMVNLLACTDVATVFLDTERRIQRFTPAATRLFRLIASDLGRPVTDVVWTFEDSALLSDIESVFDALMPREALVNTGDNRHYIRRIAPYRSSRNQIGGVVLTFVDITDIQRARAMLEKQAHQRDLIAQLSTRVVVGADPMDFAQRSLAAISETTGATICHFFECDDNGTLLLRRAVGWAAEHSGSVAEAATDIGHAFAAGATVLTREFSADGGPPPAYSDAGVTSGLAVAVPGPVRPYGVIGAYSDKPLAVDDDERRCVETIAWLLGLAFERNATDHALRDSAKVFMESRDPIVIEDGNGVIIELNEAAEAFFRWSRDDLLGRPMTMLFAKEAVPTAEIIRERSHLPQGQRRYETTLITADGGRVPVMRSVSALNLDSQHRRSFASIFTDISPIKEAEAKLLAAHRLSQQTNEEKTRFLGAVSHDLRQPLQALRLLLEVLKGSAHGQQKKVVEHLDEALTAMEGQLSILMDVTSLETGQVRAHLAELDLHDVLDVVAAICAPQAAAKGLDFKRQGSHYTVWSDRLLLERMIQNLVINAIRHTVSGKVLLACRRRGDHIRIEVWDTGPGIPEDKQADIFEDFYQLGNAERDRKKGYGLGLSIVGRMAKLLGYGINVRSRLGKGSVFTISIPLSAPPAAG